MGVRRSNGTDLRVIRQQGNGSGEPDAFDVLFDDEVREAAGDRQDRGGRGDAVGGDDGEASLRGEMRRRDGIQASD